MITQWLKPLMQWLGLASLTELFILTILIVLIIKTIKGD